MRELLKTIAVSERGDVMNQGVRRMHFEYAAVSLVLSVVSWVSTRMILGDSGIGVPSVGLLLLSALFFWRGCKTTH